jgi:murein DD-endopeptidase MepM/ murein hydrolase activator NlpD
MKKGTKIHAARKGVVRRLKKDGKKGGWNKKYRAEGNYIVIQHDDGSMSGYWHLQYNGVLVNVGDTIQQGQVIGLSGRTGYALFPHLHFLVWWPGNNNQRFQSGSRFQTSKGIIYLRPFRRYKNNSH